MRTQFLSALMAAGLAAVPVNGFGQKTPSTEASSSLARTAAGKPDLSGIWQVLNTAAWDIQRSPCVQIPERTKDA